MWYRYAGAEMGYTGNNSTSNVSTPASIAQRTARAEVESRQGTFRGGRDTGSAYIDRTGFDTLNSYYQGSITGSYTVRGGESLQAIAANLYGDANLWYTIAEANGLSGSAWLVAGQTLRLPAGVVRSGYNASTYKPYDPAEAIGDLSPTNPRPERKKGNKCGVFGQILIAVVAVAVAAVATGGILALAAPKVGLSGGLATIGIGSGTAITGATAGGIAAASAVGSAVGSIVSQGLGVATGIQDTFSWKGVGFAALGAFVSAGISPGALSTAIRVSSAGLAELEP